MGGRVCSFQLFLSVASAVFLGPSPAGLMSIMFLTFIYMYIYIYIYREREREREREETVGGGSERHYIGSGVEKTISLV
jgi:hypothetical protein